MKRIVLFALAVTTASTFALAQGGGQRGAPPPPPPPLEPGASQADVDLALMAAPAGALKNQATVIKWKKDFTYETLRKGTNKLVCYDRSGFPTMQPFNVQCTSLGNLEREAQNLKAQAAAGGDRTKAEAALDEMEKNGTRIKPEYGSIWYTRGGPDKEHARPDDHITIAVPMATSQSTGLPDKPAAGGAWIMNAGTMKAHIMVPGS